jgi:polysaccharide biosynthesis protein VpsM
MKNIVRNLTLVGCVGSSAFAAPFLAIGDNAELFVTADAIASYNDNIFLVDSGATEDTILTFKPGFDLQFGKDSAVKGNLIGTSTLTSYTDNEYLNNQLFGIGGVASYESGGRLTLKGNASYNEFDQPTIDVSATNTLVERAVTNAGVSGELTLSEKISVGTGFSYSHTDYKSAGYTEDWNYSVPVNVYYELTPKVDVSTGVTYTRTDLRQAAPNRYDAYYYNVGARGSFTPKLSGSFDVGYNTRFGADDDASVGANAALSYAYSDKTQFGLSLGRDFSNAAAGGDSYENTQVTLSFANSFAADWRLNASATYRTLDYQVSGNKDEYLEGSLGATYIINNMLSTSLAYTYRQKIADSATPGADFENNVVSLSLSARY